MSARKIVFDIETTNTFRDVGSSDPTKLDLAVVSIYDYSSDTLKSFFKDQLNDLWKILENTDILIGFNSDHFDLPLLNKYSPFDLTQIKSLDLLKEIQKSVGRRIKLDTIAEATLGVKKSGHGLQAIAWWAEGKYEQVKKYCEDDVMITKKIYDYALAHNKLKYIDLGKPVEFDLDTSGWEHVEQKAVFNKTLF